MWLWAPNLVWELWHNWEGSLDCAHAHSTHAGTGQPSNCMPPTGLSCHVFPSFASSTPGRPFCLTWLRALQAPVSVGRTLAGVLSCLVYARMPLYLQIAQKQPVEFDQAINYVNKIKVRNS